MEEQHLAQRRYSKVSTEYKNGSKREGIKRQKEGWDWGMEGQKARWIDGQVEGQAEARVQGTMPLLCLLLASWNSTCLAGYEYICSCPLGQACLPQRWTMEAAAPFPPPFNPPGLWETPMPQTLGDYVQVFCCFFKSLWFCVEFIFIPPFTANSIIIIYEPSIEKTGHWLWLKMFPKT